jgi:hypothetical protein
MGIDNPADTTKANQQDGVTRLSLADVYGYKGNTRLIIEPKITAEKLPSADSDPLAILSQAIKSGDQNIVLSGAQKAYEIAQGSFFDPQNLQDQINLAKSSQSPRRVERLKALDYYGHARALTSGYLAAIMMQEAKPDVKSIIGHLVEAAKDPAAAELIPDAQGKPILDSFSGLVAQNDTNIEQQLKDFQTAYNKTLDQQGSYLADSQKVTKWRGREIPIASAQAAQDLDSAIASAEEAVKKGQDLRKGLGIASLPELANTYASIISKPADQQTPAEIKLLQQLGPTVDAYHCQSQAAFTLAKLEYVKGDHNAALKQLNDLVSSDPSFIATYQLGDRYQQLHAAAQSGAQFDNEGLLGETIELAQTHAKEIAAGVGLTAAVVIGGALAIGTAGAAVPIEAAFATGAIADGLIGTAAGAEGAITASTLLTAIPIQASIATGVIGGGLAGTAAGAEAESSGNPDKTFLNAALDVAPAAFAGSSTGALLFAASPLLPILSKGAETAIFEGSGSLAAATRGAVVFGPLSGYNTYSDVQSGKDKTVFLTASDFLGSEVQMAGGGAIAGLGLKAFIAGSIAKNVVAEGFNPSGHKSATEYALDVSSDTAGDLMASTLGPTLGTYGKMAHNGTMKALSQWLFTKNFATFPALSEYGRTLSAESFEPLKQTLSPDQNQQ